MRIRLLLAVLIVLALPSALRAAPKKIDDIRTGTYANRGTCTAAVPGSSTSGDGERYRVTDGAASTCAAGGGAVVCTLICQDGAWAKIGSGGGGGDAYTPNTPGDWPATPPTTVVEGLDSLALVKQNIADALNSVQVVRTDAKSADDSWFWPSNSRGRTACFDDNPVLGVAYGETAHTFSRCGFQTQPENGSTATSLPSTGEYSMGGLTSMNLPDGAAGADVLLLWDPSHAQQYNNQSVNFSNPGTYTFEARFIGPTTAPTAANDYLLRVGYLDDWDRTPTDAADFFIKADDSTYWIEVCGAGTCTEADTGVSAMGSNWTELRVECETVTPSCHFYRNGAEVTGSPLTGANVPVAGENMGMGITLNRIAGSTTLVTVVVDYVAYDFARTTAREKAKP